MRMGWDLLIAFTSQTLVGTAGNVTGLCVCELQHDPSLGSLLLDLSLEFLRHSSGRR